jgi:hypothetical protein
MSVGITVKDFAEIENRCVQSTREVHILTFLKKYFHLTIITYNYYTLLLLLLLLYTFIYYNNYIMRMISKGILSRP